LLLASLLRSVCKARASQPSQTRFARVNLDFLNKSVAPITAVP
jgi:hypothetical protein